MISSWSVKRNTLYALVCVALSYFVLATGVFYSGVYSDRLYLYVGAFNLLSVIFFYSFDPVYRMVVWRSLFLLYVLLFSLLVSMLSSFVPLYALDKIEGAVVSTVFASALSACAVVRVGEARFVRYFMFFSLGILALTIGYRLALGLSGREGRFFINGPIVFGWLMGFNFICGLLVYSESRKIRYLVLSSIFLLAVLWSQSKGPFVAALVVLVFIILKKFGWGASFKGFLYSAVISFFAWLFVPGDVYHRFYAIYRIVTGNVADVDYGSVSVRHEMWSESINLWLSNPWFGAGLGNWSVYIDPILKYPHNWFFESISESGLFGITILLGLISYVFFRVPGYSRFFILYFMICLSFSGDASYLRFLFFYPIAVLSLRLYALPSREFSERSTRSHLC